MKRYFLNLFEVSARAIESEKTSKLVSDFLLKVVEYFTIIGALKYFSIKANSVILENITYLAIAALQVYFISIVSPLRINIFQFEANKVFFNKINLLFSLIIILLILGSVMFIAYMVIDELATAQGV